MDKPRATQYLVQWSGGKMGGFYREDILLIAIAENRGTGIGEPVTIWNLSCTLPIIYEPITVEEIRELTSPDNDPEPEYECPFCLTENVTQEHIRKCSGYHQQPTINEIVDAYSEPCESAKRDSLLNRRNEL